MRSECEMIDLIVDTARGDERVRAVVMNGSRADPSAPRDPFQDYDVVYVVTNVEPFRQDREWIDRFGELMILQTPDDMGGAPPREDGSYTYLMQFTDGNRIDLGLREVDRYTAFPKGDRSVVLLDKDGMLEGRSEGGDGRHVPVPPTAKAFADCCNEFWWVCPYVAKGLWREELPYALHCLERLAREQLMKMLGWHVAMRSGFSQDSGKFGRNLERRLEPDLWSALLNTYAGADCEVVWNALFAMCDLFRRVAVGVSEHHGFEYEREVDERVSAHLRVVRDLPAEASDIY